MAGDAMRLLVVALASAAGTMLLLYESRDARCSVPDPSADVFAAARVQVASEGQPAKAQTEVCTQCRGDFPDAGKLSDWAKELPKESHHELQNVLNAARLKRGDTKAYRYTDANDKDVKSYMKLLESRLGGTDPEEEYWINLDLELGAKRGGWMPAQGWGA